MLKRSFMEQVDAHCAQRHFHIGSASPDDWQLMLPSTSKTRGGQARIYRASPPTEVVWTFEGLKGNYAKVKNPFYGSGRGGVVGEHLLFISTLRPLPLTPWREIASLTNFIRTAQPPPFGSARPSHYFHPSLLSPLGSRRRSGDMRGRMCGKGHGQRTNGSLWR
jgi:hypothetical protein